MDEIYKGRVYIRPIGRGWHLLDRDGQPYLENAVEDGYYEIEVKVRRLEGDEKRAAEKQHMEG